MGYNATASGDNSLALKLNDRNDLFDNSTDNSFQVWAEGGFRFYTNESATYGASLTYNANSWSTLSDSTKKENFYYLDGDQLLQKYSLIKPRSWNYKMQDPSKFRHYGPMAQEFYSKFGKDEFGIIGNNTTIASADISGLNFSAISVLSDKVLESESNKRIEFNGNVTLDNNGEAIIEIKELSNSRADFSYHLTCIGGYANVYISETLKSGKFKISGGGPNLQVSWEIKEIK